MVDNRSQNVCAAWDTTGLKSGGWTSRSDSNSSALRQTSTCIPALSNHDRIDGSIGLNVDELNFKEGKKSQMPGSLVLQAKRSFAGRARSESVEEASIEFPEYEECAKIEGYPEIESQEPISATFNPIVDDTYLQHRPTIHVDYLSHDWLEEDIWASWKHITSQKEAYTNGPRLENASWRLWGKKRSQLKTISPESIDW